MSCSWPSFYKTDNPNIKIGINLCDKNHPQIITIAPNENDTVLLSLKSKNIINQEFNLRFLILLENYLYLLQVY